MFSLIYKNFFLLHTLKSIVSYFTLTLKESQLGEKNGCVNILISRVLRNKKLSEVEGQILTQNIRRTHLSCPFSNFLNMQWLSDL